MTVVNGVPEVAYDVDASPLARVFAKTLGHLLLTPDGASLLRAINIAFAVKSANGPQAITVDPTSDTVEIRNGVSATARIVLTLDLGDPLQQPVIKGWLRHPLNTLRIGRLLSLPGPGWQDSARSFWVVAQQVNGNPGRLTVTNLTEGGQLTLGDETTGGGEAEIQGGTAALQSVLSGQSLLAVDVMSGKLKYRGSLMHLATLSSTGQKILLGEADG